MKKISTVQTFSNEILKEQKLSDTKILFQRTSVNRNVVKTPNIRPANIQPRTSITVSLSRTFLSFLWKTFRATSAPPTNSASIEAEIHSLDVPTCRL